MCTTILLVMATIAKIVAVISVILRTVNLFAARIIAVSTTPGCYLLPRGEIPIADLRLVMQCIDPGGIAIAHCHACTCNTCIQMNIVVMSSCMFRD